MPRPPSPRIGSCSSVAITQGGNSSLGFDDLLKELSQIVAALGQARNQEVSRCIKGNSWNEDVGCEAFQKQLCSTGDVSKPLMTNKDIPDDRSESKASSLSGQERAREQGTGFTPSLATIPSASRSRRSLSRTSREVLGDKLHPLLMFNIISAVGLRDADSFIGQGASDAYCVFEIIGKPESKVVTPFILDNCNPVWNFEFSTKHVTNDDTLLFSVWDKDPKIFKQDDFLGRTTLSAEELFTNGGFHGNLDLLDDLLKNQGTLRVKIAIPSFASDVDDQEEMMRVDELIEESRRRWPLIDAEAELENVAAEVSRQSSRSENRCEVHLHGGKLVTNSCLRYWVLHPYSAKRMMWDLLGLFFIGYDFFTIPYTAAFDVEQTKLMDICGFVVTAFWMMDLFVNFFTGYHQGGLIEMRPKRIMKNYLQTWFFPDICLVTVDVIYSYFLIVASGDRSDTQAGVLRIFRSSKAVRTFRILLLVRLSKIRNNLMSLWNSFHNETTRMTLQIVGMLGFVFSLAHLMSCGWYALSKTSQNSWTEREDIRDFDVTWRYVAALQWSFSQFTPSSSDIHAKAEAERVYAVITTVIGMVVFSTFISGITGTLATMRRVNQERRRQAADLRRFFSEKQVSLQLSKCITDYHKHSLSQQRKRIREEDIPFFKQLPLDLLSQLHMEMYMGHIVSHPFITKLSEIDVECFRKLCHKGIQEIQVRPAGEVFASGAAAANMYFVVHGELNYHRKNDSYILKDCQWISEPTLWIDSWKHRGRLSSNFHSDILQLSAGVWSDTLGDVVASTRRGRLTRFYAMLYVHEGAENGFRDDLWVPDIFLAGIASSAFDYALGKSDQDEEIGDEKNNTGGFNAFMGIFTSMLHSSEGT